MTEGKKKYHEKRLGEAVNRYAKLEEEKNKPLPFLENDSEKILSRKSSKATEHKIGLEINFFKVINHFKKPSKEDVYESYFYDNCRNSRALIG